MRLFSKLFNKKKDKKKDKPKAQYPRNSDKDYRRNGGYTNSLSNYDYVFCSGGSSHSSGGSSHSSGSCD